MDKNIINIFGLVFFGCKSNETIIVQENCHRLNHCSNQNVYSKVKLMVLP